MHQFLMEQSAAQGCGCWRAEGERVCEPRWEMREQTSPAPAVCVEQKELLVTSVTAKLTVPVGAEVLHRNCSATGFS